jgi:subtilase family serine protease
MSMSIRLLMLASVLGLSSQAFAMHLHHMMTPNPTPSNAPCVFPDGTNPGPDQRCYNPSQFFSAYGIDKLHAAGLTGKGQVIVLVDSYGSPTMQADLDHFSDAFGLPRTTIQYVYPNGTFTNPMLTDDEVGWAGETTLDLEWAHAIAPDATLVNVVTNSDETVGMAGMQDMFDGMAMAAQKYPGAIISMSFAAGELTFTQDDIKNSLQGSLHQIFVQATQTGSTLLAGAGDNGSVNISVDQSNFSSSPDVNYPAADPLVTAVGGTALQAGWRWNPQGTADDYWACQLSGQSPCAMDFLASVETPGEQVESLWKEDWLGAGGGGGVSRVFATPDFQASLSADVQKTASGHRTLPDMAMSAAVDGGVQIYSSYTSPSNPQPTGWQVIGGTSAATPETAALVALAGEQASQTLGKNVTIGNLNEILYSLPSSDFNDILPETFGAQNQVSIDNNSLYFNASVLQAETANKAKKFTVPPTAEPGYAVTVGYDMATGLGSPKAQSFVMDLAAARVAKE